MVILPQQRWADAAGRWRRVEDLGFAHAWTYDHLSWRTLRDEPWFATVPTLTAAALSTTTLRLGTWVATPNFRHPVPFAKELMTLDHLSGGRLNVGLGAGTDGYDATMLGQPALTPRRRHARFVEFVEVLAQVLAQPRTSRSGDWYVVDSESRDAFSMAPERLWSEVLRRQNDSLKLVASYPDDPLLN